MIFGCYCGMLSIEKYPNFQKGALAMIITQENVEQFVRDMKEKYRNNLDEKRVRGFLEREGVLGVMSDEDIETAILNERAQEIRRRSQKELNKRTTR